MVDPHTRKTRAQWPRAHNTKGSGESIVARRIPLEERGRSPLHRKCLVRGRYGFASDTKLLNDLLFGFTENPVLSGNLSECRDCLINVLVLVASRKLHANPRFTL